MKKMKTMAAITMVALVMVGAVSGCQSKTQTEPTRTETVETPVATETKGMTNVETSAAEISGAETRIFKDSAGREVEIPAKVQTVAPSGPLAQMVLYTYCPDNLAGLAADFSDNAKKYVDKKYYDLPKFGQFYGKNANLNMEALIAKAPDVVIDIGEAKKSVKEDMDALQEQIGIPVIFIEATLPTMPTAYTMLGELMGDTAQAKKLAEYSESIVKEAEKKATTIKEEDRKRIYFAAGDKGLHTNARGSIHADVIELIGAVNVTDVEPVSRGAGSEVSFEQLLLWQPDTIIVETSDLYDSILSDPMWKELTAVKEGHIYLIPEVPYSFMNTPPSINRIIGISWLGNLMYPEVFQLDIKEEVKLFYQMFYHVELSEEEVQVVLTNALAK